MNLAYLAATNAADKLPGLFAAPGPQAPPSGGGDLVRVTIALLLVLTAVLVAAWFSRRLRGLGAGRTTHLELIGQLQLGQRERAVLIRVGGERLLLGVASGNVRTLHVLPEGASTDDGGEANVPEAPATGHPTFKALLWKSLGR